MTTAASEVSEVYLRSTATASGRQVGSAHRVIPRDEQSPGSAPGSVWFHDIVDTPLPEVPAMSKARLVITAVVVEGRS
jgi:hypothetical protein